MVVDTSALIAILLGEAEAPGIARALKASAGGNCFISAATLVEAYVVIFRKQQAEGLRELELLIRTAAIAVEGFHEHLIVLARNAYMRFGPGTGHKARLNFGDCFTYALALDRRDVILCKGNDFIHTDAKCVEY